MVYLCKNNFKICHELKLVIILKSIIPLLEPGIALHTICNMLVGSNFFSCLFLVAYFLLWVGLNA